MSLNGGEKTVIQEDEKSAQLLSSSELISHGAPLQNEQKDCKDRQNLNVAAAKKSEEAKRALSKTNVSTPIGDTEGTNNAMKQRKRVLSLADTLLSLIVIAPSVIGCWRGIWTLMDLHADIFPTWPTFFWGVGIHIIFTLLRKRFSSLYMQINTDKSPIKRFAYQMAQIIYIYLFGVACNAHWRCGWIILDEVLSNDVWVVVSLKLLLFFALAIMRCLRNVLAPPFIIAIDKPGYIFEFPTRYNVNTRDWSLYLLDCAFSVGVVGTLVVFVWRGVWILFDLYLFPEDQEYSAVGSLAIGYVIVAITFCLQPLMRYVCARLEGLARLIVADAFLLLSFLGTVNVWRGIWNVLDLWLLPDNPELSCWITHVGCFVFLVLLNCSNSILVRGVYIDAEEDEGKCVVFPCHYLRLFFKIEREKKEARRRNLLVASGEGEESEKNTENAAFLSNSTTATIIPGSPESLV